MRLFLSILFFLFHFFAWAQSLDGIWRGKLTQEPGGCFAEYFIEMQIQSTGKEISGFTYDYYDTSRFVKFNFTGRMNPASNTWLIIETKVLDYKIPVDCIPCIKTYDLNLSRQAEADVLSGSWKGVTISSRSSCSPGQIFLKKVEESVFKNDESSTDVNLAAIKDSGNIRSRKVELNKTLYFDTSLIKVELYDNGLIDGDTVSIFLNSELILSKKRLTDKPIMIDIPVTPGKDYEMVMYAENLGAIPPNTALMVVRSGKIKYEVFLSSTEQKSAAVKFRYTRKE
jgi:hypothetical protein